MNREQLISNIKKKRSFLCVGLDTDIDRVPAILRNSDDPVFEFNKLIIDATKDHCIAYKPNIAFYESLGPKGWDSLQRTIDYIPEDIFTIADAKRGDIGNTSAMYAKTFFSTYDFDSVTVAPYMGHDSVQPFLQHENKWVILLALTSNSGADDFQQLLDADGTRIFEHVLKVSASWGTPENLMYVIGATKAKQLEQIRAIAPDHFLLVPGVGAQGGSLDDVCKYGMNDDVGLIINASRSVIYASSESDFAEKAAAAASSIRIEMEKYL
jgi:orotidine-5'-phosphate decarboxylase